jgi:hypothetical protein
LTFCSAICSSCSSWHVQVNSHGTTMWVLLSCQNKNMPDSLQGSFIISPNIFWKSSKYCNKLLTSASNLSRSNTSLVWNMELWSFICRGFPN